MNKFFRLFKKAYQSIFVDAKQEEECETKHEVKPTIPRIRNPKKGITKHSQVLEHLMEQGSIDSWTAINLYGATRLSAIIFNLRRAGYNIESVTNTAYDRNNQICNFTTYHFYI